MKHGVIYTHMYAYCISKSPLSHRASYTPYSTAILVHTHIQYSHPSTYTHTVQPSVDTHPEQKFRYSHIHFHIEVLPSLTGQRLQRLVIVERYETPLVLLRETSGNCGSIHGISCVEHNT